ncbi:MAG TPA: hypothetical protein VLX92_29655 [Kofleriaceae bacterium]|nr:hypothetical protein [Kofleriaceae bacterium]
MICRSGFTAAIVLAGCGAAPSRPAPAPAPIAAPAPVVHHLDDPDLNHHDTRLLAIDWAHVTIASDADALALWQQIAPTGDDWDEKLAEIPTDQPVAHALALAMLAAGNFTCAAPAQPACVKVPIDLPDPPPGSTLTDPCLRRMLALWSLAQLDDDDLPRVLPALRAIVAIPPPESQLVAAALKAVPENDQDDRLALLAIAWKAGQRDVVDVSLGDLDEAHLVTAVTRLHIDGALEVLPAETEHATYLAAITDEQLAPGARAQAMVDLTASADALAPDVRAALLAAAKSPDCSVAAAAARALALHGQPASAPAVPRTSSPAAMMRAMCVLASFEQLARADEPSYLHGYIPPRGLELIQVTYDPYGDGDAADPHTSRSVDLVPPDQVVLPELDDLVRAMRHCTGTTCHTDEHEFRFTWKPYGGRLLLARLEVIENPPCKEGPAISNP